MNGFLDLQARWYRYRVLTRSTISFSEFCNLPSEEVQRWLSRTPFDLTELSSSVLGKLCPQPPAFPRFSERMNELTGGTMYKLLPVPVGGP